MKILSKYKDYYDYLVGYYGIDPKLVLDRRQGITIDNWFAISPGPFTLAICGNLIRGFYDGKRSYCGENLLKIGKLTQYAGNYLKNFENEEVVEIKFTKDKGLYIERTDTYYISKKIEKTDINNKKDCPILLVTGGYDNYQEFPRLSDFNIPAIYSAEEMFEMLSSWLSNKITEKENIVDTRSDVMKLESKGFSNKCSFRPKMKSC